jgi:beta-glucosidase/6-phospho-beta-glucosidase/beta-galactosidase
MGRNSSMWRRQYLAQLAKAMREGVDVRGYFVWSLLDNVRERPRRLSSSRADLTPW